MSEYGEPDCGWVDMSKARKVLFTIKNPEFASRAEAALAGIEDPEQFMADVREIMQAFGNGRVMADADSAATLDRLAAQLKGDG